MKLLDQLEQQAQKKQEREEELAVEARERGARYHQAVEPAMQRLLDYLKQLTSHLNYLEHQREIEYEVPHYGRVRALTNPDFKTQFSSEETHSEIRLDATARINRKESPIVEVNGQLAKQLEQILLEYGLHAAKDSERTDRGDIIEAKFQVYGTVSLWISVRADVDSSEIVIEFHNVDRLGMYRRSLTPDRIDDEFLDDLGRFVARDREVLVREELSPAQREKIRRGVIKEQTLLGSLFNRKP